MTEALIAQASPAGHLESDEAPSPDAATAKQQLQQQQRHSQEPQQPGWPKRPTSGQISPGGLSTSSADYDAPMVCSSTTDCGNTSRNVLEAHDYDWQQQQQDYWMPHAAEAGSSSQLPDEGPQLSPPIEASTLVSSGGNAETISKRTMQNRKAQREFRQRRAAYLKDLEEKVRRYETSQTEANLALQRQVIQLREENDHMRTQLARYQSMPSNSSYSSYPQVAYPRERSSSTSMVPHYYGAQHYPLPSDAGIQPSGALRASPSVYASGPLPPVATFTQRPKQESRSAGYAMSSADLDTRYPEYGRSADSGPSRSFASGQQHSIRPLTYGTPSDAAVAGPSSSAVHRIWDSHSWQYQQTPPQASPEGAYRSLQRIPDDAD